MAAHPGVRMSQKLTDVFSTRANSRPDISNSYSSAHHYSHSHNFHLEMMISQTSSPQKPRARYPILIHQCIIIAIIILWISFHPPDGITISHMGEISQDVQSMKMMSYCCFFLATVFGNLKVWNIRK